MRPVPPSFLPSDRRSVTLLALVPSLIALVAALTSFAIGVRFGAFIAGGADSYGYLSQAELWLSGHLRVERPMSVPFQPARSDWMFSPLGYRPGPAHGTIVPIYPPGLPLMMAAFQALGGRVAAFYVVPILGALATWLTYALGRRMGYPWLSALGSALIVASPVFLFQQLQPMSDVPVTALWLASIVAASSRTVRAAIAAGVSAGVALLTRPNLVILLLPLAAHYVVRFLRAADRRRTVAPLFAFGVPVLAACLFVAALNAYLYGSPLESGYGGLGYLYSLDNVRESAKRYALWINQTETPLMFLGIAAPLLLFVRWPRSLPQGDPKALYWLTAGCAWIVVLSYCIYFPFDNWTFLRFLLPAFPLLLLLSLILVSTLTTRLPRLGRAAVLFLVAVAVFGHHIASGRRLNVLGVAISESRYQRIGEYVAAALPERSLLVSLQHSGSLRYYSGRLTVRYDWVPPDELQSVLDFFTSRGYRPYFVLDGAEEEEFRNRFGQSNPLGRLDWPPQAETISSTRVRVYDPEDRARFVAGESVATQRLY